MRVQSGAGGNVVYRYNAYIAKYLARIALLVCVSLTSIVWLTQALRMLDFIVNQGVSVQLFLWLTLLLLPSLIMLVLPIAVFVALVFLYHRFKADSELIAFQAAGLDKWRLSRPAILVAVAAVMIGYSVSLYLMPVSYGKFRDMQSYLRNNYVSVLLQEGVFANPVDGLTVFIRERARDGTLKGVLVHDNRQPEMSVTMMAESAQLAETDQGPRFLLANGNRQEMKDGRLSYLNFDSYALDINLYAKDMAKRTPDPQERFLSELLTAQGENEKETQRMRAEGHQRIVWPLYAVTLTLVGLAVLLSGEFNRRMRWQRNLIAVGLAAMILFIGVAIRNLTATSNAFIPLAYLNLLLPSVIAGLSLSDMRPSFKRVRGVR